MLAPNNVCDLCGKSSNDLTFGVDEMPKRLAEPCVTHIFLKKQPRSYKNSENQKNNVKTKGLSSETRKKNREKTRGLIPKPECELQNQFLGISTWAEKLTTHFSTTEYRVIANALLLPAL